MARKHMTLGEAGIKVILFDLDGTILNTNLLVTKGLKHTLSKHLNINLQDEELYQYFGEPLTDTFARFDPTKISELLNTFRSFDLEHHESLVSFFPGVTETIEELSKKGLKLGIVTSKQRYMASKCTHLHEIEKYLDVIITFEDAENAKPDPEPILNALEILNEKPSNALMIGDSPADIQSANNAGVLSAAVKWSVFPLSVLEDEHPNYFLSSFTDLLLLVLEYKRKI